MNSVDSTNAPREITIGPEGAGEAFTVSALEHREWAALQAWLLDHAKDPVIAAMESLNRARKAGVEVSPADRKALLDGARAEVRVWPPRYGTPEWFAALQDTEGGSVQFLAAVLRKHQPHLTDDDIGRLNAASTDEQSQRLIYRAMGYVPTPAPGPKAAGATADPAPAPSPTTGAASATSSSASA